MQSENSLVQSNGSLPAPRSQADGDAALPPVRILRPLFPRSGVIAGNAAGLERIFDENVSTAVWRRGPVPQIADYLAAMTLSEMERVARVGVNHPDFQGLLAGFAQVPAAMTDELTALLDLYATVTDCTLAGVRLLVTRKPPCPRFHVDRVALRLNCTWLGRGAQWVDHQDVNRRWLGHAAEAAPDEVSGLLNRGAQIRELQAFNVALFKGELWPGNAGRGAVHRSPPAHIDGWRVLVTIESL